jgi:hypothetical protein
MRYLSSDIPEQYRNPVRNVILVPCWASDLNVETIEIPEGWEYPLPDPMPEPLLPPLPDNP